MRRERELRAQKLWRAGGSLLLGLEEAHEPLTGAVGGHAKQMMRCHTPRFQGVLTHELLQPARALPGLVHIEAAGVHHPVEVSLAVLRQHLVGFWVEVLKDFLQAFEVCGALRVGLLSTSICKFNLVE